MAEEKKINVLNLGAKAISIASFSKTADGGLILEKYKSTDLLGDPAAEASYIPQLKLAVNELISDFGLSKSQICYNISAHSVFSRFVKLPPLTKSKVSQIVEFEARQNVPFPINEVIWDYQLLGESQDSEVKAALVAIKADVLNEINHAVENSSVQTDIIDVSPFALVNAFRYNYSDVTDCSLIVDIGARGVNYIYVEGNKVYIRTSTLASGSTISQEIAKEFNISFAEAENRKIADGFVALGGAYADHEDPNIAAMSKIIRNVVTRIHGDIIRTNTFYRSQHQGSQPRRVFIVGGCAGLGYIKEFFEEKLGTEVEFFNSLRNVKIASGVPQEIAATHAHVMGELIGLGLRKVHRCPMEIDLVPDNVQLRRDLNYRKPFFLLSAANLLLLLLGLGIFFTFGAKKYKKNAQKIAIERNQLSAIDQKLKDTEAKIKKIDERSEQYTNVLQLRKFWVGLLDDLNKHLPVPNVNGEDVFIWYTSIEPLNKDASIMPSLVKDDSSPSSGNTSQVPTSRRDGQTKPVISHIKLRGLYIENNNGPAVINEDLFQNLKKSKYFNLENLDLPQVILSANSGAAGNRWAYPFVAKLPLIFEIPLD